MEMAEEKIFSRLDEELILWRRFQFLEVILVPTQCLHFRVTHFLFFISFPERLSHSEENERRRVGTFR